MGFPDEIITAAVDAVMADRNLVSEHSRQWALSIVRPALEGAAVPLGEFVAGKITAHRDLHDGGMPAERIGAWRRHFGIAARVAARAFLTEDDLLRLTAQAIERGDFAVCRPEDGR